MIAAWRRYQGDFWGRGQFSRDRKAQADKLFALIVLRMANVDQWRMKMGISQYDPAARGRPAWSAGRQVGAKRALKVRQIWAIRFFLDREGRMRDRSLFDLAIDSKLRGCDLVKLKIGTLVTGHDIRARAMVIQQKTGRPVQFEFTSDARTSLLA